MICLDNRVLLVASAGSGKTSVMVAKAGYALTHNYFAPERMLLLAFNNDAAAELRERIRARLEPLGLPADKVVAKTFHAFGLEVIGAATGKKPSLVHCAGLDDEEFDELEAELTNQRQEFGRMLARGKVMPFAGALVEFMYLCGIRYEPADGELQTASRQFLVRLVKVLDWRLLSSTEN